MKLLIAGLSGSLAPRLAEFARIGWQRGPTAMGNNLLGSPDDWQDREARLPALSTQRPSPLC